MSRTIFRSCIVASCAVYSTADFAKENKTAATFGFDFRECDSNSDGKLSLAEVLAPLLKSGNKTDQVSKSVNAEAQKVFRKVDKNSDGFLSKAEFKSFNEEMEKIDEKETNSRETSGNITSGNITSGNKTSGNKTIGVKTLVGEEAEESGEEKNFMEDDDWEDGEDDTGEEMNEEAEEYGEEENFMEDDDWEDGEDGEDDIDEETGEEMATLPSRAYGYKMATWEVVFAQEDMNMDGKLSLKEVLGNMPEKAKKSKFLTKALPKLKAFFHQYDTNKNSFLSKSEFKKFYDYLHVHMIGKPKS